MCRALRGEGARALTSSAALWSCLLAVAAREEEPMSPLRPLAVAVLSLAWLAAGAPGRAGAETTLRVVMHSDLKIVDPIWTTAYIVRNHGYMVYDTLFAMDAKGEIRPLTSYRSTICRRSSPLASISIS